MLKHTKRALIFVAGILLLFLGIIGLALPFLQGILFIAIALLLLSIYSPTLREWVEKHTRKYPKIHAQVTKVQQFLDRIIGEA